jgi:hypothetical protein
LTNKTDGLSKNEEISASTIIKDFGKDFIDPKSIAYGIII